MAEQVENQKKRHAVVWRYRRFAVIFCVAAPVVFLFSRYYSDFKAFMPTCWFFKHTGLHCPGCGITRAAWRLSQGDMAEAIDHNALILLLPLYPFWRLLARHRRIPSVYLLVALLTVFAILRNLPMEPFSRLAP